MLCCPDIDELWVWETLEDKHEFDVDKTDVCGADRLTDSKF
jgi:hypothetical protein